MISDILGIISEYETPHDYYMKINVFPKVYTLQKYEKLRELYSKKNFDNLKKLFQENNRFFLAKLKEKLIDNVETIKSHQALFRGHFGGECVTKISKKIKYKPLNDLITPYKNDIINHCNKYFIKLLENLLDLNIIDTTILLDRIKKSGCIDNKIISGKLYTKVGMENIKIKYDTKYVTINNVNINFINLSSPLTLYLNLYQIMLNTEKYFYLMLIRHLKTGEFWEF